MKKFLSMVLALVMVLAVAAPALAEETPTVTYLVRGGTAQYEPYIYPGLVGLLKIQQMAGVNVDWTVICGSGDEINAQYLSMMASGNYPDIIQWQHNNDYTGGVAQMYADGICIRLNEVIDQYMPNYKALLEANPHVAKTLMDDEGNYLYFTVINPLNSDLEKVAVTWWGLMMRQDWLDNVGMEAPTTIDEWYEVLTAFKEGDPNGNGELDEIPFDAGSAGHFLFMPAFGIQNGWYVDPETGKVAYGQYTEKYKAYLETMAKWYAEGLLQNIYTDEVGTLAASADPNIYADLAGSWKGLSNYWEQRLPQVLEKNPNADFVAVQWPQYVNGNGEFYADRYGMGYGDRYSAVISTDCKNIEAAARLIDQMYTEEGTNCTTWGTIEGDPINPEWTGGHGTYTVDENGVKHETEWANQMTENFYDGAFANKYRYAMSHVSFPRWGAADYLAATREEHYVNSAMMWAKASNALEYPNAITLSTDAQKAVAEIDNIGTYISEMTCKFITGVEPLTNFDTYMDNLQKMGIDNLVALYQEAYDSFMNRGN
ncbi:MAG: extracellular solute-binding protein [Clostridia bacterium]|nr:extracellular solute-binding protein [Clostridia bacterium]